MGRENPAPKLENPLDLVTSWAMLSVADICHGKVYRCDMCVYMMGAAKVDLSYHGYRSSGSDAPAPTQATLHMRAGAPPPLPLSASQGPRRSNAGCLGD